MKRTNGAFQQYTSDYLLSELILEVDRLTQKQVAAKMKITPQFLNDVLKGRREISERVARGLGYTRKIVFEKVTK